METKEKVEAEELRKREDVKQALRQTAGNRGVTKPIAETRDKVWFSSCLMLLIGLAVMRYLLRSGFFILIDKYIHMALLQRLTNGTMLIVLVLGLSKGIQIYLIGRIHDAVSRYNLKRILRLIIGLILALIVISILFVNWYTMVVSLGLISLILG